MVTTLARRTYMRSNRSVILGVAVVLVILFVCLAPASAWALCI